MSRSRAALTAYLRQRRPAAAGAGPAREHLVADLLHQAKRAWAGAHDDRLTKNHWGRATSSSINQDLAADLPTLRDRVRFERHNNAFLEGMATSYAVDVVGAHGPRLQVLTADTAWADRLERLWADWWTMPDVACQLSGPDFLKLDVRMECDCGESFKIKVTDRAAATPIKLRLQSVHPRRIESPVGANARDLQQITLGVRRSLVGKPLSYFVREDSDSEFLFSLGTSYDEIAAANVLHDFSVDEPGQVRGVPALAVCLQVVAQLRDWDRDVQQAMRMAAMLGVLISSDTVTGTAPIELTGTFDVEPGVGMALPPGYKAQQIQPGQPGQKYNDYRGAKLAEVGRPLGMPRMLVELDSSRHNYSSARLDTQTYNAVVRARQARMRRVTLDPLLAELRREAQLARMLGPTPADVAVNWVWHARPHVDPVKERNAQNIALENGTASLADICAENGSDWEAVEAQRNREAALRDRRTVERIAAIQAEIDKAAQANPRLQVTWPQVLAALGALSAPGAYLTGAAATTPSADDADPAAQPEDDA